MQISVFNPEKKLAAIKAAMDIMREAYSKQTLDSPYFGYVSQLSVLHDAIENEMFLEKSHKERTNGNAKKEPGTVATGTGKTNP